ncbi:MAG TPA: radical SAM protein, partial [Anaerolineae bacterium]|nr:radical SAM protein [Anaerolineae bacterium]
MSNSTLSLDNLLTNVGGEIRPILTRALSGSELNQQDAITLFGSQGFDLLALMAVADQLRQQQVGDRITYVKVRNINFTNVCYTACKFCEFGQPRGSSEAYTFSLDEVVDQAVEAWEWGCKEVCIQGGLNPILGGDIYVKIVRALIDKLPNLHIHAFSPFEIQYSSQVRGKSAEYILSELK